MWSEFDIADTSLLKSFSNKTVVSGTYTVHHTQAAEITVKLQSKTVMVTSYNKALNDIRLLYPI